MTTGRFLAVVAVCFCGLLSATQVRADSVVVVNMSALTYVGTGGTEKVSISFNWDVTTNTIVPGTVSTSSSGVIGESFDAFISYGSVVGGEGFLFQDPSGDRVSVNTCGFDCRTFPSVGTYNTSDAILLCGTSDTCSTDGLNGLNPNSGTFTVSTVPEPSSLLLLVGGIFGLWPVFGRRSASLRA